MNSLNKGFHISISGAWAMCILTLIVYLVSGYAGYVTLKQSVTDIRLELSSQQQQLIQIQQILEDRQ